MTQLESFVGTTIASVFFLAMGIAMIVISRGLGTMREEGFGRPSKAWFVAGGILVLICDAILVGISARDAIQIWN